MITDIQYLLTSGSAWVVAGIALVAAGINGYYIYTHRESQKKYLRGFTILAAGYVAVLYSLLGAGAMDISILAAMLSRIGITIAFSLIIAEVIADWKN